MIIRSSETSDDDLICPSVLNEATTAVMRYEKTVERVPEERFESSLRIPNYYRGAYESPIFYTPTSPPLLSFPLSIITTSPNNQKRIKERAQKKMICHKSTKRSKKSTSNHLMTRWLLVTLWSWRGLNPRPNGELIRFLHA